MKQLIVMVASVMLGVFLFQLICGPQDTSVMSGVKGAWNAEIQSRTHEAP